MYNCCLSEWSRHYSLLVNSIQLSITYTIKLDIPCTVKKSIYDGELQGEKNNMCLRSSLRKIKEEIFSKALSSTSYLFPDCYQKHQYTKSGSCTEENISSNSTLKSKTYTCTHSNWIFPYFLYSYLMSPVTFQKLCSFWQPLLMTVI